MAMQVVASLTAGSVSRLKELHVGVLVLTVAPLVSDMGTTVLTIALFGVHLNPMRSVSSAHAAKLQLVPSTRRTPRQNLLGVAHAGMRQ